MKEKKPGLPGFFFGYGLYRVKLETVNLAKLMLSLKMTIFTGWNYLTMNRK